MAGAKTNPTVAERGSEREFVVSRTFNASSRIVFEAWSKAELFQRWWVPKSFGLTLVSCDMDARTGGKYRLVFRQGDAEPVAFFGTYTEVTPQKRLVWTNEEAGQAGAITTVTFEEVGSTTRVLMCERFPSKEALDAEIASGSTECKGETFEQLDELLATL